MVIGDIDDGRGEKSAAQMRARGFRAEFVHLDVTCEQDWQGARDTVVSTFGKLNVLVNNAGIDDRYDLESTPLAFWEAQMSVNAKGVFLGMQHAIAPMRAAGGASIVNISSINGIIGSPGTASYDAAKGAVRVLSKSAAVQLAKDNIRVNSIHPGYAFTPMTEARFSEPEVRDVRNSSRAVGAPRLGRGHRWPASCISPPTNPLSSPGAELVIDGGVTAQ